jgi:hypothetical protein
MDVARRPAPPIRRALPDHPPDLVRVAPGPASRSAVSTGHDVLDDLLGGGFPRGRLSELVGPRTSGRTRVLLGSLAGVTARGALAALVDATDALDPASAVAVGVDLARLLWVRCDGEPVTALRAADVLLRGGGFDMVAVDLGEPPPLALARLPAAVFVRLQRTVEGTTAALLLAGSRRVAGSLTAVALGLEPRRVDWARGGPGYLAGLTAEARLIRTRDRAPGASIRMAWVAGDG